jgi:hypothetical protein
MDDDGVLGIPIKRLVLMFVVGTVLGVMLVAVWVIVRTDTDQPADVAGTSSESHEEESSTDGPAATRDEEPSSESPAATPQPAVATRMERCVDAALALRAPLAAARPALDQWDVHVGAMNQLVDGEITLQQATEFWDETRLGAQRHVERFRDAWAELRRHGVDCPAPALMAPGTAALRPCVRHVEAELQVLAAAKTSIDTWDKHVRDMEMLRMGMLSPEDATKMWLAMWRRGVRDLDAYRLATRNPRLKEECPESASSG